LEQEIQTLKKLRANQEDTFDKQLEELSGIDGNPEMHEASDSLDQLVSRELRLAGKNRDEMQKVAEEVFMIGGRVCRVKREGKKDLMVTFVKIDESEEAAPEQCQMPIKKYLAAFCGTA
jgi:hypothetical protein